MEENSNTEVFSWGIISTPTPGHHLSMAKSPVPSQELGSRSQAVYRWAQLHLLVILNLTKFWFFIHQRGDISTSHLVMASDPPSSIVGLILLPTSMILEFVPTEPQSQDLSIRHYLFSLSGEISWQVGALLIEFFGSILAWPQCRFAPDNMALRPHGTQTPPPPVLQHKAEL